MDATSDVPVQLSKLAVGLYSLRYIDNTIQRENDDGKDADYDGKDGNDSSINNKKKMISLNEDGGNNNDMLLEKYSIAPYMFKHVISNGNAEFSSGRQQDVSEYYQYLLQVLNKIEKIHYPRYQTTVNYNTSKLFEFHVETRMQCLATGNDAVNDSDGRQ